MTCATFRSKRDAELTKAIYRRVPVLIQEAQPEDINPWGVKFTAMFHMSNASHLFRTRDQLEKEGYQLQGNVFVHSTDNHVYLPLYEGRMINHFDHRNASVGIDGDNTFRSGITLETSPENYLDPFYGPLPRYWVNRQNLDDANLTAYEKGWFVGFKDVTAPTNSRTAIFSIIPRYPTGHKLPLVLAHFPSVKAIAGLIANLNAFIFDYIARQKQGGLSLGYFILKQLPLLPPDKYSASTVQFVNSRVLELIYTAWDLQSFAQDVGYDGPPFMWDEDRRFLIRCELDALYFRLYGIARDDVDYIMETFPIIKRKDETVHGEYRTKRGILELYDEMAGGLQGYTTRLNPPPADPSTAHH